MNIGDKITVLSRIGLEIVPEHGIVYNVTEYGDAQWKSDSDIQWRSLAQLKDEGVLWILGHHNNGSKEVAAMRVAHALGRTDNPFENLESYQNWTDLK